MRYIEINKNLFLVEQEIVKKSTKAVTVQKSLNHIFIYDRSGSMYGVLSTLIKDLKARLRTVPVGDTVTIGWFSSPGEFRFPLKGLKVNGKADFDNIDKVLDANNHTLGSTCFSEILDDTKDVIKDLKPLGNGFALAFLTDGYPTVYPYETEVKAIHSAVKAVSGEITSSIMVGYGNYYNKELMADMAERFGGSLIHSSDLATFPVAYQKFLEGSRSSEPKMLVELHALPHANGAVFSLNSDGAVNIYAVENGEVAFSPTKNAVDRVYVLTDKKPKGGEEFEFAARYTQDLQTTQAVEAMTKAVYASALVLTQRTKTDLAMDALSTLGDVALVERANNAFTNAEYGAVEQGITEAIGNANKRFTGGKKVGCLPKPDAFCLLDALDLLMSDDEAEFQPYHDEFMYNKIGVGSKTKDGYPTFEADKEARVPMVDLKWNDTKLNLSILARINGTVELPTKSAEGTKRPSGLDKTFTTNVFRNFTVVKDGFLNVTTLPVSMSKPTYEKFLAEGVIDQEHNRHYKGRVYVLHLDRIPVINRVIADGKTSAKTLCTKSLDEMTFMANLKVLKAAREEIEPRDERGLGLNLTPEQEAFLKEVGVGRSGFSPPVEKLEATDFYMAKEFEVKIKGLSSLPKIDEVKTKVASKKALTASQELIAAALREVDTLTKFTSGKKDRLSIIDTTIANQKDKLAVVRSDIQRTKFAVILAKKWFDEFTSRDDNKLTIAGTEFTVGVREVKVEI